MGISGDTYHSPWLTAAAAGLACGLSITVAWREKTVREGFKLTFRPPKETAAPRQHTSPKGDSHPKVTEDGAAFGHYIPNK